MADPFVSQVLPAMMPDQPGALGVASADGEGDAPVVAQSGAATRHSILSLLLWTNALLLLAGAQVLLAGYRLGVGNQSIQIPFVRYWMNQSLYAKDPAIVLTEIGRASCRERV